MISVDCSNSVIHQQRDRGTSRLTYVVSADAIRELNAKDLGVSDDEFSYTFLDMYGNATDVDRIEIQCELS